MGVRAFDLYPRKCRMCGKQFEAGDTYVYKCADRLRGSELSWFCSWHCKRKWEKWMEETGGAQCRQ